MSHPSNPMQNYIVNPPSPPLGHGINLVICFDNIQEVCSFNKIKTRTEMTVILLSPNKARSPLLQLIPPVVVYFLFYSHPKNTAHPLQGSWVTQQMLKSWLCSETLSPVECDMTLNINQRWHSENHTWSSIWCLAEL